MRSVWWTIADYDMGNAVHVPSTTLVSRNYEASYALISAEWLSVPLVSDDDLLPPKIRDNFPQGEHSLIPVAP